MAHIIYIICIHKTIMAVAGLIEHKPCVVWSAMTKQLTVGASINQSNLSKWISLIGAICHRRVNRRRRWMAVSGVELKR